MAVLMAVSWLSKRRRGVRKTPTQVSKQFTAQRLPLMKARGCQHTHTRERLANCTHSPEVSLSRRRTRLTTATACRASSRVGLPPLRTLPGRLSHACAQAGRQEGTQGVPRVHRHTERGVVKQCAAHTPGRGPQAAFLSNFKPHARPYA